MAGEAALTKVKAGLAAWLTGHVGTGVDVYIDRAFDDSFQDDDCSLVNIRCPNVSYDTLTYNSWLHSGQFKFDIICRSGATSIEAQQQEIAATIVSRMSARTAAPGTIGELIQDARPISMGPDSDETRLADEGETTFEWSLQWLTPIDDFRTVVGPNGPIA